MIDILCPRLIGAYVRFEEGSKILKSLCEADETESNNRDHSTWYAFSNSHASFHLIVICFHSAVALLDELKEGTPGKEPFSSQE